MIWSEVQITTTNEAEDAVAEAFYEAGAGGVAIESRDDVSGVWNDPCVNYIDEGLLARPAGTSVIKGYFPSDAQTDARVREILLKIAKMPECGLDPGSGELKIVEVADEDWANSWKKYFVPTKVSSDITVVPSWESYAPKEGETIIDMDPGMAFGTGTHETTRLCAEALEKYVAPGMSVVDVGCGTGILSIIAAKAGAGSVIAIDLDPVAVRVTRENAEKNGVADQIKLYEGNLLEALEDGVKADLVVANILAQAVIVLASEVGEILAEDGVFIASGIITEYLSDVVDALEENSFTVLETAQMGEWHQVTARKL